MMLFISVMTIDETMCKERFREGVALLICPLVDLY